MLLDYYNRYTYRGDYNSNRSYIVNDIVRANNNLYVAVSPSTNVDPTTDREVWNTSPYNYQGVWDSGTTYNLNDAVVGSDNNLYVAFVTPPSTNGNPDPITNPTPIPWQRVVNTLSNFLADVRSLVWISIDSTDLPDETMLRSVYLRSAELETIERLGLTSTEYRQKLQTDPDFRERVTIAIQRREAAKIIPALPQIISQQIFDARVGYAQINWEEKINLLINESNTAINEDLVEGSGEIFDVADRFVGF